MGFTSGPTTISAVARKTSIHSENIHRKYGYDNLRCFLIACVVLGHLLEIAAPFKGSGFMYRLIYSFHMPAFIFLFGYFARYNAEKIVFSWIFPYVLFQTLYSLFSCWISGSQFVLQFTTPYWLLWYMLCCIFYQLLIPLYTADSTKKQIATLTSVVILAILVGHDSSVGYYMTLSRFFVFQPWFVLGLYLRNIEINSPPFFKRYLSYKVYNIYIYIYYSCHFSFSVYCGPVLA